MVKPPLAATRRAGFTLIELLVVLAIVATLLTLTLPRYFHTIDTARETVLIELVQKRYLRSLPVDPILESSALWNIVPPPADNKGKVYDLKSTAPGRARDGRALSDL